ncbi:MAG: tape measure protein [Prevotella sp.]
MALKFEITGDNRNFLESLDGARGGVHRAAQDIESSGIGIEEMFKRIGAAAGIAFTLDQAKNFAKSVMDVRGQFQQLEIAFSTMLQSEEKASMLMSQLVDTAAKTPFDLQGVAQGAKQLLAYGIAADEVNETITRLGDIAAGLSIPLGDLVYLYGTTMTQGRMFTQDLRQFMGRGIPMADELAKQFGVAKNEVAGLVTAGKVGADAVKKAIWNMTEEGSRFGGLMAEQSKSITGQISNLEDQLDTIFNSIGKSNEGIISSALSSTQTLLDNWQSVGTAIMTVVATFGAYKAALIATSALRNVAENQRYKDTSAAIQSEIAAIQASLPIKQADTTADLRAKVAKGELTQQTADEIAKIRELNATEAAALSAKIQAQVASGAITQAQADEIMSKQQLLGVLREEQVLNAASATSKNADTAATATNTAATNASTTAENLNTTATVRNTLQTRISAVTAKATAAAHLIFRAAVNGVTASLQAMKAALMTNPIGAIIGAVTMAIGAFMTWKSSTDEATDAVTEFSDAANEAASKAQTLYAVIENTSDGTKIHQQALEDLKKIAEEYGITLNDEKDLTQQLIDKKKELIAVIKEEAIERQYADAIANSAESYKKKIKDLQEELSDALSDDFTDEQKSMLPAIFTDDDFERIKEAREKYDEALKEFAQGGSREEYNKANMELLASWGEISARAKKYAKDLGLSVYAQNEAASAARTYVAKMAIEITAHNKTIDAINKSRDAAKGAAVAAGNLSSEQERLARKNRLAKLSVAALGTEIQKLISKYNNSKIGIEITYSETKVPKWMQGLKEKGKNIDSNRAKELAAYWASWAQELEGTNNTMNGLNYREALVRSAQYEQYAQQLEEKEKKTKEDDKDKPKETPEQRRKRIEAAELSEMEANEKASKEREELERKIAKQRTENAIEALKDGQEKTLLQMEFNHEQQQEELEREMADEIAKEKARQKAVFDASENVKYQKNKNYVKKNFTDADVNKTKIDAIKAKYTALFASLRTMQEKESADTLAEMYASESQHLRDFLLQYGDYQQQRLAIAQEYAEKISKAQSLGERLSLEAEREGKLQDIELQEIKAKIDWESVFNDLDKVSISYLKGLKGQLERELSNNSIRPENAKVLAEQIGKINDAIVQKQYEVRNLFGFGIEEIQNIKRLKEEEKAAKSEVEKSQEELIEAQNEEKRATEALQQILRDIKSAIEKSGNKEAAENVDGGDGADPLLNAGNTLNAIRGAGVSETDIKAVENAYSKLADTQYKSKKAAEKYSQAQDKSNDATDKARMTLTDMAKAVSKVVDKTNQNIQSANALVETLGLADTAFGKGFSSLSDASQSFSNAFQSIMSGDVMGALNGVVGGLMSIGDTFLNWFGNGGESDPTLEEDIERLTLSNEALQKAITALTEEMKDASMGESVELYRQMINNLNTAEQNQSEQMQRTSSASKSGLKGKHSSGYRINEGMSSAEWQRISAITGQAVYDASSFFALSSENMAKVQTHLPDLYAKIKDLADNGYQDAAQYMDSYVEYAKQREELEKQYYEKLTSTSYDNVRSKFKDMLRDMTMSARQFSQNFNELIVDNITEALMTQKYDPLIKQLYEDWAKAMENDGRISEGEMQQLEHQRQVIYDMMQNDRQYIDELTERFGDYSEDTASSRGFASMSQESADELNGRFSAVQIAAENIGSQVISIYSQMLLMSQTQTSSNNYLQEIRNMMITGNSYLEDIAKYSKQIYLDFATKLDDITTNTK